MPDEAGAKPKGAEAAAEKGAKKKKAATTADAEEKSKPGDDGRSENSAGDAGTENDASSIVSGNSAHDEILIDFRRGRLLKKLAKLVKGPTLMVPVKDLDFQSYVVILCVVVTHVAVYSAFMALIADESELLKLMFRSAATIDYFQRSAFRALQIPLCLNIVSDPTNVIPKGNACDDPNDAPGMAARLKEELEKYMFNHQATYLGIDNTVKKLPAPKALKAWDEPTFVVKTLLDTLPPKQEETKMGLWEAGNMFVYNAWEIVYHTVNATSLLGNSRQAFFIQNIALDDGTSEEIMFEAYEHAMNDVAQFVWDSQDAAKQGMFVMLIIEVVIVLTLLHLYQLYLVINVERARLCSILALVGLPGPILRIMHNKPVTILEDDSDDEREDEEDGERKLAREEKREQEKKEREEEELEKKRKEGGGDDKEDGHSSDEDEDVTRTVGGYAIAGPKKKAAAALPPNKALFLMLPRELNYNGRTLVTSWFKTARLVLPLFLWQLAVLVIYAYSDNAIGLMHGPLASLHRQMLVLAEFAQIRTQTITMVQTTNVTLIKAIQDEMKENVDLLEKSYDALLYGADADGKFFPFKVPPATFTSAAIANVYFKDKKCFNAVKQNCFKEGHPYFEVTHNGLDAMVRRLIRELRLLANDDPRDINYTNTRFDFMYQVGSNDLQDGLREEAALFRDLAIEAFMSLEVLHTALLAVTIVLAAGYIYFVIRPYVKSVRREATALTGLLSHTPKELDVLAHVRGALKA